MRQKRIGYVVFKQQENGRIEIPQAYAGFIGNLGIPVPIFALDDHINMDIDLLILGGGQDVDPDRYDQKPSFFTQNSNIQLEYFDKKVLPEYINRGIPVFGICRGLQTLNVHFGGSLLQHIKQKTSASDKRYELVHDVTSTAHYNLMTDFLNMERNNKPNQKVNSLHHQGFKLAQCAEQIAPIFTNPEDDNVEALWVKGMPIVAVQWHPEEIYDKFSFAIINALLRWKR